MAYESNETGRQEVWVAVYHADAGRLGGKWQISLSGGRDPLWSPDGRELYYEDLDDHLVSVAVAREAGDAENLTLGARTTLFDLRALNVFAEGDESYDVAPSGGYFVMVQEGAAATTEVRVVLHWLDELRRLVPAGEKG